MRLFVSLDLPEEVRRLSASWGREVARASAGARAVRAGNTHITLAFLGDRSPAEIPPIADAMRSSVSGGFTLSLGAPVRLPRRRPRALAFEVHDQSGGLAALQAGLAEALTAAIGWKAERSFRPHLTAVRFGRSHRGDVLELPVTPAITFTAESISLVQSRRNPEGAEYEFLETVDLQTPASKSHSETDISPT